MMNKAWIGLVGAIGLLAMLTGCSGEKEATAPEAAKENKTAAADPLDEKLRKSFQPLGEMPVPADNEMSEAKVELGKQLFFDPRLSGHNKSSCATCHAPGQGWGDGLAKFATFTNGEGPRNSPTVINSGYYTANFWDGRAKSLEEQALGPIQSDKEMNQPLDGLIAELQAVPGYVEGFKSVFGSAVTAENVAKALAAFERTVVIRDSKFDKYLAGDLNALTAQEKKGGEVFLGKGSCASCHTGPNLTDNAYHNLGHSGDEGRYAVTKKEEDKGRFRTPGLRGLSYTKPYFHDGSAKTLEDVVEYYDKGGEAGANKDPLMKPLGLTAEEKANLVAFLKAMDGTNPTTAAPKIP